MPPNLNLRGLLFSLVPKYNSTIYTACKRYVDHFNGQNNSGMVNNGEFTFVKANACYWNVVFDVGAHKGEWTASVLSFQPQAQIHCFEPFPDIFEILRSNDFPQRVILNQLALSASAGNTEMYTDGGSGLNSLYDRPFSIDTRGEKQGVKVDVQMTTVDDYCHDHNIESIDMMKMDVEGSELDVLKGAERMLGQRRIKCIQFEYDSSYIYARVFLRDMFQLLQPIGYQLGKIFPEGPRYYPYYEQRLETFTYQNWVANLKDKDNISAN